MILFICDNFPPENNAPAQRTYEHCKHWVEKGEQVTVITSFPNHPEGKIYPGYSNRLFKFENVDGIKVLRIWTFMASNSGVIRRLIDHLSFGFGALIAGIFLKNYRIVIATSPQFFAGIFGALLAKLRSKPFLLEIRDLWPASIEELEAISNKVVLNGLRQLEYWMYRRADLIVVVTRSTKKMIVRNGVDAEKVIVVRNGFSSDRAHVKRPSNVLNEILRMRAEGSFVVGYVGTVGLAHGLSDLLVVARELSVRQPNVRFVVIGGGAQFADLRTKAVHMDLENLCFFDSVPSEAVPGILQAIDLGIIMLKNKRLFLSVIPSKMFEYMACGLPILLCARGESAMLVKQNKAGLVVNPEQPRSMAEAIIEVQRSPRLLEEFAANGKINSQKFTREMHASKMLAAVKHLLVK